MAISDVTRRRFIGAAGAAAATALFPPSLQRALAETPRRPGSLRDVEHVILLMQENRSFDQYFGTLSGVRGFDDPRAKRQRNGRPVFYQPDPKNPDGFELPFHSDAIATSAASEPSLSHSWIYQHSGWNGGAMDNWVGSRRTANGDEKGPLTMGYFTRQDIPFHFALADMFTICDNYHCSVMGETQPNRMYAQTGTIDPDGKGGGPQVYNGQAADNPFTWTTYMERLEDAGVSWRMYFDDYGNMTKWFKAFQEAPEDSSLWQNGMVARTLDDFAADVDGGQLPQVSWLNGPYSQSEHPKYMPAAGAVYIYNVLEILARNPAVWEKTVLFITYDENDGYFDHVVPPTPPPGTPGECFTVPDLPEEAGGIRGPIGLGFRVPMLVVSPWSQGGWVCSETFDHSSFLRFCERRFGVREPNISAWRRRTCGDLTATLQFGRPDNSFPTLQDPAPILEQEEAAASYPPPTVPTTQKMPHQEPGARPHLP
ncbi:MAG TPA: phospholipase C, phosphocholine-specific [Mycobacteriales bacterium]|nr:phospholipase C, phosphocholine-specific [Mycobacteriales bacterium]